LVGATPDARPPAKVIGRKTRITKWASGENSPETPRRAGELASLDPELLVRRLQLALKTRLVPESFGQLGLAGGVRSQDRSLLRADSLINTGNPQEIFAKSDPHRPISAQYASVNAAVFRASLLIEAGNFGDEQRMFSRFAWRSERS
jgi:hypothetical protein